MQTNSVQNGSLNDNIMSFFSFVSCFQNNFSVDWLVAILGIKVSELLTMLDEGIKIGWIEKKANGFFRFKNTKIRRELEDNLPTHIKEANHKKIYDYFLRELKENDERLVALSYHLQQVQCNKKECGLLMQAGDMHLKLFQQERALECYEKILSTVSNNKSSHDDKLFIESAIKYSKATTAPIHGNLELIQLLKKALKLSIKQDIKTYQAQIYLQLAKNEWMSSQNRRAIADFKKGWTLALQLGQTDVLRSAHAIAIYFSFWRGSFSEGIKNYEAFVPDIQNYNVGQFPLLATLLAGHCYGQIGQISQGIGALDALYKKCIEKKDFFMASYAKLSISVILLDMGKTCEALKILKKWTLIAKDARNDWAWIWGTLALAVAYYRLGNINETINFLKEFLAARKQSQINLRFYSYIFELSYATNIGKLPSIDGLSLQKEIDEGISGRNVFIKGVAYRYKALEQKRQEAPQSKIIDSLKKSIYSLTESGQKLELAISQFEMARLLAAANNMAEARKYASLGSQNISLINKQLLPHDIKEMAEGEHQYSSSSLNEILNLTQEFIGIKDNKELLQNILSRANQLTGAERGAIFLLQSATKPQIFTLRASKNLTVEDINASSFRYSLSVIRKSVEAKKAIIESVQQKKDVAGIKITVRFIICVPMVIKNRVIGVLYNDNSVLQNELNRDDLNLLSYFAGIAASVLENSIYLEKIQKLNERLKEQNLYYEELQVQRFNFGDMIGESDAIKDVFKKIKMVANTNSTVLIHGETGVGKELVARAIHRCSKRHTNPFIRVFCSALPETLIASELFGHEKGAFTGAHNRRIGRLELANGGTLFLDEISELPLDIQTKFLIVLQNKEFERLGSSETITSDFRLIVATNRNLTEEVRMNNFRSDLYYRINVFPIYVPPLRERKEDIPLLASHFLKIHSAEAGKKFSSIPTEEMKILTDYDWPGNVRELNHAIERCVILSNSPDLKVPKFALSTNSYLTKQISGPKTLKENEKEHILSALNASGWKIRGKNGAASRLDIKPTTLEYRMKKLGLCKTSGSEGVN